MPGDELLSRPTLSTTRGITIDAPAHAVWPWLVQVHQDRTRLDSYGWLENLFNLNFHNSQTYWCLNGNASTSGIRSGLRSRRRGPRQAPLWLPWSPRHLVTAGGDPARFLPPPSRPPLPTGGHPRSIETLGERPDAPPHSAARQLRPRPASRVARRATPRARALRKWSTSNSSASGRGRSAGGHHPERSVP